MSDHLATPPEHPRRIAFFGTPEMAVPPLEALHAAGFEVGLVVTGADKRRGRRSEPSPTPVKRAALDLGLPVSHDVEDALAAEVDLGVVVAFGRLIRRPILERLPMINLHFSLLPRWRGAAPVERALLAGDDRTGVCVMAVDETLDTGDVYARREIPIHEGATASELRHELTRVGSRLLVDTLAEGLVDPVAQEGEVTYAAKIGPDDLALHWSRTAAELDRIVRVGGAWTRFRGRRLKVHGATLAATVGGAAPGELQGTVVACGEGALDLVVVQPEGKARIEARAWLNGAQPRPGERFETDGTDGGGTR